MSHPAQKAILLATIGAAHGIKGEVRVKSFTGDPAALGDYGPLRSADGRSFEVERLRPAKHLLIVKFRGVNDRSAAETLNGVALYVDRSALPPPEEEEFYHADLIGLAAHHTSGESLGTITAIYDYGAGDVLEIVRAEGPSLLVPFTKAAVPEVDLGAHRAIVIPPSFSEDEEEGMERDNS